VQTQQQQQQPKMKLEMLMMLVAALAVAALAAPAAHEHRTCWSFSAVLALWPSFPSVYPVWCWAWRAVEAPPAGAPIHAAEVDSLGGERLRPLASAAAFLRPSFMAGKPHRADPPPCRRQALR
jgi:hypothetical protein